MFSIGAYYRGDRDIKPTPYDDFGTVQSSLFHNLESICGIDHQDCALALPCWGPGDPVNYAGIQKWANSGVSYVKNQLHFSGGKYLTIASKDIANSALSLLVGSRCVAYSTYGFIPLSSYGGEVFWQINSYNKVYVQNAKIGTLGYSLADNKYHQLAFCGDDSINAKFFDNGEKKHNTTANLVRPTVSLPYTIGGYSGGLGWDFKGLMGYFLLFTSYLSDSVISAIHENPNALWQRVAPVSYFFPVGESVNTLVDCSLGSLILTEHQTEVNAETSISVGSDTLSLTEYSVSVAFNTEVIVNFSELTLTEYSTNINYATAVFTEITTLVLTEYLVSVVIRADVNISVDPQALVITEYLVDVTVGDDVDIVVSYSELLLIEYPVNVNAANNVSIDVAALTLIEYTVDVNFGISVIVSTSSIILSELLATINAETAIDVDYTSLVLIPYLTTISDGAATVFAENIYFNSSITKTIDFNSLITKTISFNSMLNN